MRLFVLSTLAVVVATGLTYSPAAQNQPQPITFGVPVTGRLEGGDQTLTSGEYYDAFTFQGQQGQFVSIRLNSTEFDPYVILRLPDKTQQDNDDFGGSVNAGIDVTLPATGTYRVLATTYQPGETGTYSLSVSLGSAAVTPQPQVTPTPAVTPPPAVWPSQPSTPPATPSWPTTPPAAPTWPSTPSAAPSTPPVTPAPAWPSVPPTQAPAAPAWPTPSTTVTPPAPVAPVPSSNTGGGPLTRGQTVSGVLANGDHTLTSGEYYDEWTIQAQAGQSLTINMNSDQFDTYIIVVHPSAAPGQQAQQTENDDFGTGTNSQVSLVCPVTGEYRILATSYAPGNTGTYTLSVN